MVTTSFSTSTKKLNQCWMCWFKRLLNRPVWKFWKSVNLQLSSFRLKNIRRFVMRSWLKLNALRLLRPAWLLKSLVVAFNRRPVNLKRKLLTKSTCVAWLRRNTWRPCARKPSKLTLTKASCTLKFKQICTKMCCPGSCCKSTNSSSTMNLLLQLRLEASNWASTNPNSSMETSLSK